MNGPKIPVRTLYTYQDLARRFQCSVRTIARRFKGRIVKDGKLVRVTPEALQKYLKEKASAQPDPEPDVVKGTRRPDKKA